MSSDSASKTASFKKQWLDKYRNMPASDRRALMLCSIFLLTVVLYVQVFEPLMMGYADSQTKLEALNDEYRSASRKTRMLPRREARLAEVRKQLATFNGQYRLQYLSLETRVSEVINELTKYASDNGVTLKQIRPLDSETQGEYAEIPYELELSGNYAALLSLIQQVESSALLLVITDMNLSKDRDSAMLMRLRISDVVLVSEAGRQGASEARVFFEVLAMLEQKPHSSAL